MTIRIERRETQAGSWSSFTAGSARRCSESSRASAGRFRPAPPEPLGLTGADEAGLRALRTRVDAGARLEGVSPYIRLLLESED